MHSNIWSAVNDAVLNNDIAGIASNFGAIPVKTQGIAVSILIDIAMIAWGVVMGPAWNKRKSKPPMRVLLEELKDTDDERLQ